MLRESTKKLGIQRVNKSIGNVSFDAFQVNPDCTRNPPYQGSEALSLLLALRLGLPLLRDSIHIFDRHIQT